jgi:hypothetical protein
VVGANVDARDRSTDDNDCREDDTDVDIGHDGAT